MKGLRYTEGALYLDSAVCGNRSHLLFKFQSDQATC